MNEPRTESRNPQSRPPHETCCSCLTVVESGDWIAIQYFFLDHAIGPLCSSCRNRLLKETRQADVWNIEQFNRVEPILVELGRQDSKWGKQDHTLPEWMTILMEEVGELAAAVLGHSFGTDLHPELDWKKEAVQVAAVALAMTEQCHEVT